MIVLLHKPQVCTVLSLSGGLEEANEEFSLQLKMLEFSSLILSTSILRQTLDVRQAKALLGVFHLSFQILQLS